MSYRTLNLNPSMRYVAFHLRLLATLETAFRRDKPLPDMEFLEGDTIDEIEGQTCVVSVPQTRLHETENLRSPTMSPRPTGTAQAEPDADMLAKTSFTSADRSIVIENDPFRKVTFANLLVRSGITFATVLLRIGRVRLDGASVAQTAAELDEEWRSEVLYYGGVDEQLRFSWGLPIDAMHMIGEFGVFDRVRRQVLGVCNCFDGGDLSTHVCECNDESRSDQVNARRF